MLGPGRSRDVDLALRRAGIENFMGRLVQLWLVGSTVFASVLFAVLKWRRRTASLGTPLPQLHVEGALLAMWWFVLMGILAYGFMLGMGG